MFWYITIGLFVVSFLWALWGLRREMDRPHNVQARRKFAREKILFRR